MALPVAWFAVLTVRVALQPPPLRLNLLIQPPLPLPPPRLLVLKECVAIVALDVLAPMTPALAVGIVHTTEAVRAAHDASRFCVYHVPTQPVEAVEMKTLQIQQIQQIQQTPQTRQIRAVEEVAVEKTPVEHQIRI